MVGSSMEEFLEPYQFRKLLDDDIGDKKKVKKVIVCTGQVWVDLLQQREKSKKEEEVAIVRLEQVGPFPYNEFEEVIKGYNKEVEVLWVQEEHYNFGAYTYIKPRMNIVLEENGYNNVGYEGRPIANQTATGMKSMHSSQLKEFLERAFS